MMSIEQRLEEEGQEAGVKPFDHPLRREFGPGLEIRPAEQPGNLGTPRISSVCMLHGFSSECQPGEVLFIAREGTLG